MIYTPEMIKQRGFNSPEEFSYDFVKKYGNCGILIYEDGSVYASYDYDTQLGAENEGFIDSQ